MLTALAIMRNERTRIMSFYVPLAMASAALTSQTTYNLTRSLIKEPETDRFVTFERPKNFSPRSLNKLNISHDTPRVARDEKIDFTPMQIGAGVIIGAFGAGIFCGPSLLSLSFGIGLTVGILYALHEASKWAG